MVRPYSKVTLSYLGQELNLNTQEVESLLIDLISSKKLAGLINQPEGFLIMQNSNNNNNSSKVESNIRVAPLLKWISALEGLGSELVDVNA